MKREIVALAGTGLAALFIVLAAATGSVGAEDQAPMISGEAAYAQNCAACHRTPARFMRRYADRTPMQRKAELDRFLTGHHTADPVIRAAIVDWLEAYHAPR